MDACTDAVAVPKPPWRPRKEAYIAHMDAAMPEARLVSCADKLHNARAILCDYRQCGDALWSRFNGGKAGTLWYYRSLADAYLRLGVGPIVEELDRTVAEIERLASRAE